MLIITTLKALIYVLYSTRNVPFYFLELVLLYFKASMITVG